MADFRILLLVDPRPTSMVLYRCNQKLFLYKSGIRVRLFFRVSKGKMDKSDAWALILQIEQALRHVRFQLRYNIRKSHPLLVCLIHYIMYSTSPPIDIVARAKSSELFTSFFSS